MRRALAVFLVFVGVGVVAQTVNPFLGSWKVTWEGQAQSYEAHLVVADGGGSWKTSTRQKNNPCVGREVPVRIDSNSSSELKLTLRFSEVIAGCNDSRVTLTLGADGAVTGKRGKSELVLSKE